MELFKKPYRQYLLLVVLLLLVNVLVFLGAGSHGQSLQSPPVSVQSGMLVGP